MFKYILINHNKNSNLDSYFELKSFDQVKTFAFAMYCCSIFSKHPVSNKFPLDDNKAYLILFYFLIFVSGTNRVNA